MTAVGSGRRSFSSAVALLGAAMMLGCPAFSSRERVVDRTPIVNTGVGASIIYPGQSPPGVQGSHHPNQAGQGGYVTPGAAAGGAATGAQAPGAGAASSSVPPEQVARGSNGASGPAAGGHITMIGGTTIEEKRHQKIEEAPIWWKYVRLPFAAVAAPFAYVADKLRDEPEPGPAVPGLERVQPVPPARRPPREDYEAATLRQLEDELDRRAPQTAPGATPQQANNAGGPSLAAELAALRSARAARPNAGAPPPRASAPGSARTPPATTDPPVLESTPRAVWALGADGTQLAAASGHVDRDGDGRTDQWIFREGGEIVRELLDEDFDGRPDRALHYDLASHQIHAIEEDANHDGRSDTWTSLRDGAIVRRRTDGDADGHVDTWSYYKRGVLTRLERDASGDGFRDRVSYYEDGRLAREEQDDDADGLAEVVKHYDAEERIVRLEEDTNGDGKIDVISHYEGGRLKRRELLDANLLTPAPSMSRAN